MYVSPIGEGMVVRGSRMGIESWYIEYRLFPIIDLTQVSVSHETRS